MKKFVLIIWNARDQVYVSRVALEVTIIKNMVSANLFSVYLTTQVSYIFILILTNFLEVDVEDSVFNSFLCESGFANDAILSGSEDFGKCGSKIQSLKAGKECSSTSNCPTNLSTISSPCVCTPSSGGQKYCKYEKGNFEWENVAKKFKTYIEATRTCHKSRGLDEPCDQPSISYDQ